MNMNNEQQKGFTLIEIMVAVAILGIVLTSLYNLFIGQVRTFEAQRDVTTTQRDIRTSLEMLERDIRMAGLGVPRGVNPIAFVQNGTLLNAAAPDTISINFSLGPVTYLRTSTVTQPGNVIQVNSVTDFVVGNTVNIISKYNNNLVGGYIINAINTVANTLSLNADPTAAGIDTGDFAIKAFNTITYSVAANVTTGRNNLIRNDGTVQSVIIDGVNDFQLSYIMNDKTETSAPATLSDIRRIRIDLIAATTKNVATRNNQQIPREMITIVPVKNIRP
ncbi:MAG: prepilin-type N-terminal cleavage/methylation domain-containing protein [Nitrospirae bacterium]|nr:prepilin-type N-terminal cleavage/methylation domain-containing protein [Nitrospirota bacterium]